MKIDSKNAILASLSVDSHALGAHWIYDENDLKNISFNWNELNTPLVMWHKGKEKGDFTHYGDQTLLLLEYMSLNKTFNTEKFYKFWKEKMSTYKGYIDGATRNALENCFSPSNDLSICGRIAPLLLQEGSKETFLQNVSDFVSITHNTDLAKTASAFFAELLWMSYENHDIHANIQTLKSDYPLLEKWIDAGVNTKEQETLTTIRTFGPACGIDGGFGGVIHLLSLDDDFKTVMIKNAKAGGDSSARAMIVAMILATKESTIIPVSWLTQLNKFQDITRLLQAY